jgi:YMGG-like Gly-zipper
MSQYMTRITAMLMLSAMLVVAGCTEKKNDTLAQDSSLNSDIQLANADTAAKPALTDVPRAATATTAPSTTIRKAAPRTTTTTKQTTVRAATPVTRTPGGNTVSGASAGSEGAVGTIAAGSTINLTSNSRVCTNTNHVGDHFTATVTQAVSGSNGAVIPVGATATVEVTELKRSENVNDKVVMGLRVTSVTFGGHTYPVAATTTYASVDKVRNEATKKDVQKVAIGAAAGAVIGQIIGKSTKGTVIGAATGAAAGAGVAVATANYEGCVPSGGRITATLNTATSVRM